MTILCNTVQGDTIQGIEPNFSSLTAPLTPSFALPPVHLSLGAYGRCPHHVAIEQALTHLPCDPLIGNLSTAKLQLCPQNRGRIDVEMARRLRVDHPTIEWRLHANVQIDYQPRLVDLCDWRDELYWFAQVSKLSSVLGAPAYTAHAGRRGKASLSGGTALYPRGRTVVWFACRH